MSYDENNIFAQILRGDLPNTTIYEDEYVLAFHNLYPQAKIHALIIPKGAYIDSADFYSNASPDEQLGYNIGLIKTIEALNLKNGFRIISNCGEDGRQEIPHFHIHILGGERLGGLIGSTEPSE